MIYRSFARELVNSHAHPFAQLQRFQLFTLHFAVALVALGVVATSAPAGTIGFEGFPDSTILTTQYPGLTFNNAIILTSGISLNEFEFPPHSGKNVVSDNNGPMTIAFASPVLSFGGYFTYAEPLTIDGFAASNSQVASATSLFSDNLACLAGPPCSGDPGSSPNEFIELGFAGGISSVTITGDPLGGSFTMDDMKYTVPEPNSFPFVFAGAAGLFTACLRKTRS